MTAAVKIQAGPSSARATCRHSHTPGPALACGAFMGLSEVLLPQLMQAILCNLHILRYKRV